MGQRKIDIKYLKPYSAKYNPLVYRCPKCWEELLLKKPHGGLHKHIYGFADTNIGNLAMVECPNCFHKWSFHSRINDNDGRTYDFFLESVQKNENLHFKKEK